MGKVWKYTVLPFQCNVEVDSRQKMILINILKSIHPVPIIQLMTNRKLISSQDVRYYIIGACLVLILIICAVMLGMTIKQGSLIKEQTYEQAKALFDEIILTRRWSANYGVDYLQNREARQEIDTVCCIIKVHGWEHH